MAVIWWILLGWVALSLLLAAAWALRLIRVVPREDVDERRR